LVFKKEVKNQNGAARIGKRRLPGRETAVFYWRFDGVDAKSGGRF
jgi:hypothetical protein